MNSMQQQFCTSWLRWVGLGSLARMLRFDELPLVPQWPSRQSALYNHAITLPCVFADAIVNESGQLTITIEDKDPSTIWIVSKAGLAARIHTQLLENPSRWSLLRVCHRKVEAFYQRCADSAVPSYLRGHHAYKCSFILLHFLPHIVLTLLPACLIII